MRTWEIHILNIQNTAVSSLKVYEFQDFFSYQNRDQYSCFRNTLSALGFIHTSVAFASLLHFLCVHVCIVNL